MKRFLKIPAFVFTSGMFLLYSCNRDQDLPASTSAPQPPPIPSNDTLKGREFIFEKNWVYWKHPYGGQDELYAAINPTDSFSVPSMVGYHTEISIQLEPAAVWLFLPQWQQCTANGGILANPVPMSSGNGYVWYFERCPYHDSNNFLIEGVYPVNHQLANKSFKIKVRFL